MTKEDTVERRTFLRGLGVGGLACGLGPIPAIAADNRLLPITIVKTSGSYDLVFEQLLRQGNYFRQFGLDARTSFASDGQKIIAALVSGNGDMCGGGGFSSLFPAIERGAKIKIIGGAILSPVTCIYTKHPDIKSAKDLVGRSVGTGAPGALLYELVVALLIKKGVDYKKVNFVNIGSAPDVFKAVVAGAVDAGPSEVDFYSQQQKYGVHALSDSLLWNELPNYTNQAMFASEQAIAEKRDAVVHALAAYAKLYRFVSGPKSRDAWFKARAAAFGKNNPEDAESQWKFFQGANRLATNLVLDEQRINYVQKLNVMLGAQKTVLPFDQVADMSLARDALKLLA